MKSRQLCDDYEESLLLCFIFIGAITKKEVAFRGTGTNHNAITDHYVNGSIVKVLYKVLIDQ